MNIDFDRGTFAYLLQNWYMKNGRTMQAVHPRDIMRTLTAICEYENQPPKLTPQLLDEACSIYFVD